MDGTQSGVLNTAIGSDGGGVQGWPANDAGSSPHHVTVSPRSGTTGETGSIVLGMVPLTQTVSLSNPTVPDVAGHTITGTATGSQAGNPYNISIVSGPGSAAINSTTGAYSITATGAGTIVYKIWISGGAGGYLRSTDAVVTGNSGASNKIKVTIPANHSDFPIIYTLTQGGEVVGTFTQQPGADPYILTLDVGASGGSVTMTSAYSGVKFEDNHFVVSPGSTADTGVTNTFTPSTDPSTTPATPPKGSTGGSGGAKDPSNPANNSGTVWTNNTQSTTDPTTQTDLLTNATFREGVENLMEGGETYLEDSAYVDASASEAPTTNVSVDQVHGLINKLPAAPVFVDPGSTTSLSFSLPFMTSLTTTQNFSFTWDYGPWVSPLSWLRVFFLGCLSVFFFFAINRQLRDSVAN